MTPQKQTILSNKETNQLGNCLTACIASLFDLKIEDVPYFASYGEDWFSEF